MPTSSLAKASRLVTGAPALMPKPQRATSGASVTLKCGARPNGQMFRLLLIRKAEADHE